MPLDDSWEFENNPTSSTIPHQSVELAIRIKSEEFIDDCASDIRSSPSTLSAGSNDCHDVETQSSPLTSPSNSTSTELIFDQLKRYIASIDDTSDNPIISPTSPTSSLNNSIDSDIEQTPCPRPRNTDFVRCIRKTSHRSKSQYQKPCKPNKIRPPWFRKKISQEHKTVNMISLEDLKNIERSPSHHWTHHQRLFLCVMWRYYEPHPGFSQIFNTVFGLQLSSRKVTAQFKSNILLYGRKAFPEYEAVFHRTSFPDPRGFLKLRKLIGICYPTNSLVQANLGTRTDSLRTRNYSKSTQEGTKLGIWESGFCKVGPN